MVDMKALSAYHTSDAAKKYLRRRHASETRLKFFGIVAILAALTALLTLAVSIGSKAASAVFEYDATLEVTFADDAFDATQAIEDNKIGIDAGYLSRDTVIFQSQYGDVAAATEEAFLAQLAGVTDENRSEATALLSGGGVDRLFQRFTAGDVSAGDTIENFAAPLSDHAQLYFKGAFGELDRTPGAGELTPVFQSDGNVELFVNTNEFGPALARTKRFLNREADRLARQVARNERAVAVTAERLEEEDLSQEERAELQSSLQRFTSERDRFQAEVDDLRRRAELPGGPEQLDDNLPSVLVYLNGGVVKLTSVDNERAVGEVLLPLDSDAASGAGAWQIAVLELPESGRRLSDQQIAWLEALEAKGSVISKANWGLLTNKDSREAELAGVWGGIVGTFWTMVVTFSIAFPVGVMAAIYLEEFAPKNAFTDLIEVNINNLAAIPSIIFGLFGLLLLLSGFEIPIGDSVIRVGGWFAEYRSAAFVGGIVLALMTLPTIIIAGRASIRAVPPSIRSAALGLGASKVQTVMHHVLPLAMPGIMTGTIIGMAQALGETAPVLMVGMVGFFGNIPQGVTDTTAVMPALIYLWSDYPEQLFEFKTSAAIVVLLLFLIAMNAMAVFLRKRFERRW